MTDIENNIETELKIDDAKASTDEDLVIEELPNIDEIKKQPKPKSAGGRKGQTRERMIELHKIKSEKAEQRRKEKEEVKIKEEEIERIKKEKLEFEYEQAQKLKEALEKKKTKKNETTEIKKENKNLVKSASRDILKEKYLEEAKRRVMADLFS